MKFPWVEIVREAVSKFETPFYIFAWQPVLLALQELKILDCDIPVKHWLSFKSQPVARLLRNWRALGYGVEVVSEYEFLAAIYENYSPDKILINGVAKHEWLHKYDLANIRVHFDSQTEIENLLDIAIKHRWHVGLRCHVSEEYDPDEPSYGGQFGMLTEEVIQSIAVLRNSGVQIESLHFHLRSNVRSVHSYKRSIDEIRSICDSGGFSPIYLDLGGGFPVEGERPIDDPNDLQQLNLQEMHDMLLKLKQTFPKLKEVWFENGRYITARSGVLVVSVIDIKERDDSRYLICDGGRTNHALVSDWEIHDIFIHPSRKGSQVHTTICGPTCMAFDRLQRTNLPKDLQIGDHIVWMNAGAYHIPWETRFSNGLSTVLWYDESNRLSITRNKEEFKNWWNHWL